MQRQIWWVFFLSLLFFFFGFSHFLSRVVFLLYIICFCFYFLITLQMRIYLGFSRLLFFVLCTYFICFFGVVSLAQPHFRIFRMKFLFGNFTRTRTRSCCSLFPLPFPCPFPFPIPLPFSFSFAFAFRLTAACQPLASLVVVSITVRSVRTCTYTHTHTYTSNSLDIDTDVKNTSDFYNPNAGICHCLIHLPMALLLSAWSCSSLSNVLLIKLQLFSVINVISV